MVVEKQVNIDSSNAHSPGQSIKKKKMQLCIDTKDLNEVLKRKPNYTRSIDEPIAKSSGTVFTNVDTSKDCLQVILHPESRKQEVQYPQSRDYSKTFKISRFQWKQLPVGTPVAVEIFQRTLKLKVPLQELIQREIYKQAFVYIKSELSIMFTLQYFSKDKETLIQTDTSMEVFSPVLIHKNASVSTKSEFEYALSRVSPQDIEPDTEQESPIFAVNTLTNFQEGEEEERKKWH